MATQDQRIQDIEERLRETETGQEVHEAEDRLLHQFVRDALIRIEGKVDKIEQRLDGSSADRRPRSPWSMPDVVTLRNIGIGIGALLGGVGTAYMGGRAILTEAGAVVVEQAAPAPEPVEQTP